MFQQRDGLLRHEQSRLASAHHAHFAARVCPFEEIGPAANPAGVDTISELGLAPAGMQPPKNPNPPRLRSIWMPRDAARRLASHTPNPHSYELTSSRSSTSHGLPLFTTLASLVDASQEPPHPNSCIN
ncbi:hypothetical protein CDEST_08368 [Colletotrichum destructivum]|uniref:Uncharacterized protein n=1 Tax=Colletotrichum destructivum TaxID=34406 RepID=A0AAX4IJ88_9PEZI|nr:hypothetical protein CDEST_08368 [Colletotrichum destructivum]